jgi:hypothetical protein
LYLTEGGQDTEIMYRHGHELPEFAMYPLLDDAAAVADLRAMYSRVLDAAAEHGFVAMISGLDYRGSPDWGDKLGYSRAGLAEALERGIAFLRDVARPYEGQVSEILIGGAVGPRGGRRSGRSGGADGHIGAPLPAYRHMGRMLRHLGSAPS